MTDECAASESDSRVADVKDGSELHNKFSDVTLSSMTMDLAPSRSK